MHLKCKDWKRFWRKQRLQKCPNGQVMAIFAGPPKICIFWKSANGGPREILQKSPKKMPSLKRPKSTLAQMALSSNQYALEVQRLDKILAHKAAPEVPEWPSYGNFRHVTQTLIFWKSAKKGPREILQKSPKKMPSLKRPKRTLAQMALSSNQYALKVQRLDKILAHKAAPKVPEWPSYGNFRQVTQTRIFWKSAKRGPREIFQKLPKK